MNIDFFKEVSANELYITKNILSLIKNKNFLKELEKNMVILGVNNKIGKNALIILLENRCYEHIKKIISLNSDVLNYKNSNERNLLQSMLYHDSMHDYIYELITTKKNISKMIENKDISDMTFIDNCIHIINNNDDIRHVIKILKCIVYIYHEYYPNSNYIKNGNDNNNIINKLCFNISNDKYLIDILEYINIENQEYICNINECITYLLDNKKFSVIDYIFEKVIYIKFINNGKNSIFNLVSYIPISTSGSGGSGDSGDNGGNRIIMNILINVMKKSNIFKIRDIYNNNLLLLILQKHKLESSILKNIIENYNFDIHDNNIYNQNIHLLIKEKYTDLPLKMTKNKKQVDNISLKNILKKTVVGVFNSNLIHNMIYTTIFVKKYNRLLLPYIENNNESRKINDINFIKRSNNNSTILNTIEWYKNNYYDFSNHIIIWTDYDNYIIDKELMPFLYKNIKKSGIIYVKISIVLTNIRHANLLIIDTDKKTVERFEPYGEIYYESILKLDTVLKKEICDKLENYNYVITQSYPGFQSKSDELNEMCIAYGDPEGYCLAWCYLYLELRLLYNNIDVIKVINNYICNDFEKDFNFNKNDNKYMVFIRYYSNRLDKLKNTLLKGYNIKDDDIYKDDIGDINSNIIITNTNKDLHTSCQ